MQVAEVVPDFAPAFTFDAFNEMQRAALPVLLESDHNVVASAPTASGKTALAELAICRTLRAGGTALFVAPLRALTNEKEREWSRFEDLGYSVYVITGERDLNPRRAERADVLVMTPEKADSATRKHRTDRYAFVTDVDCCVIDEAHLLDSDRRGAVLEVTVARLRRLADPRIVALSATMPNIDDVAAWLDAPVEATFAFGEEYRPVPLHTGVETYAHGENAFADKYRRLYRALDLAEPHLREGGQVLVFVASRQDTVRAAEKARSEAADRDLPLGRRGELDFHEAAAGLSNETLRECALDGVAFHHAGLARGDRDRIEGWFRAGDVGLLFSTSTLAWGVNLPARCVVIRDTKLHDPLEGEVEMSPIDLLQMLGRAGRPDYDDVGYAWVVCDAADADRYRALLEEGTPIESRLAEDLDAHLAAEIALGTIDDLDDVTAWLGTTFYAVRARAAPEAYDAENLDERLRATVDSLVERGFVEADGDGGLEATPLGRLASRFYLRLGTASRFHDLARGGTREADAVLEAVVGAAEFDSVTARSDERAAIDAALGPAADGLDTGARKVLAILRMSMTGSVPAVLRSDAWVIRQNAQRLISALGAFCDRIGTPETANRVRIVEARIEHGIEPTAVGLTAIDGIGSRRAKALAAAGIETPAGVTAAGVEGLCAAGLAEGVAERVVVNAGRLPAVEVDWGDFPDRIDRGDRDMREIRLVTGAGGATIGARVTVNGVEMTRKRGHLDAAMSLPVALFGADAEALEIAVEVVFPDLPLLPERRSRRVEVVDG